MKKFLALFGAISLTATSSMAVISCTEGTYSPMFDLDVYDYAHPEKYEVNTLLDDVVQKMQNEEFLKYLNKDNSNPIGDLDELEKELIKLIEFTLTFSNFIFSLQIVLYQKGILYLIDENNNTTFRELVDDADKKLALTTIQSSISNSVKDYDADNFKEIKKKIHSQVFKNTINMLSYVTKLLKA